MKGTCPTILQPPPLSLCHVFVRGRSMHILDIPQACCLTHRSTPFSISLSHFLSSISPEAESNRAHQTGWSEQNCNWQCPSDSLWNSLKSCECMGLCGSPTAYCMQMCLRICWFMSVFIKYVCAWVIESIFVCSRVCECVPLYLSSRLSLPEMKGRRMMTSWRRFFAAWRPERALSAADLGYWKRMKIVFTVFPVLYYYYTTCI